MGRKWLYFDTSFITLKDELKKACLCNGIKFEFSGSFGDYHLAFFVNDWERQFLNKVIEYNSICEQ